MLAVRITRMGAFALACLMLAWCAAQRDTAALLGQLTWGMAEGEYMGVTMEAVGTVYRDDRSTLMVDLGCLQGCSRVAFTFSEPEPCHIEITRQLDSYVFEPRPKVERHDLTRLTDIVVTLDPAGAASEFGRLNQLNVFDVDLMGDGVSDGTPSRYYTPGRAHFFTSLTEAELQWAADELLRRCGKRSG
jgi:hypothetical protein